jgi:ppGpp synthetase/RelA/SpoT-type nucleotidyltranferase
MLRELCHHDILMYDYSVRIKSVESLIEKIDNRIRKGEHPKLHNFDDIIKHINDFVGARLMLFVPGRIIKLHELFSVLRRLDIKKITIHYHEDYQFSRVDAIIANIQMLSSVEPQLEQNQTGYFGVHYVMAVRPFDEFSKIIEADLFDKFELQVRTLLQHAWSEIQHHVIYKTVGGDYDKEVIGGQFATLSHMLITCDSILDRLCEPVRPTPTHEIREEELHERYKNIIAEIHKRILDVESKYAAESDRRAAYVRLVKTHETAIESITQQIEKYILESLQVAELYLKGGFYERAYDIYKKVLGENADAEEDKWVLLRLAETCSSLARDEEAIEYLTSIERLLDKTTSAEADDDVFYTGASIVAWKLNRIEKAIVFGTKAVECSREDEYKGLRSKLNLLYYKTDLYKQQYNNNIEALAGHLEHLKPDVEAILIQMQERELSPGKLDTLAYYFYCVAETAYRCGIKETAQANIDKASDLVNKSVTLVKKVNVETGTPSLVEEKTREMWKQHFIMIKILETEIAFMG